MKNVVVNIVVTILCLVSFQAYSTVVTVNFTEEPVPFLEELEGTGYFSAQGLSFADGTTFITNGIFLEDGAGVFNAMVTSKIIFDDLASNLFVSYAIFSSVINVSAFDLSDTLLGSFTGPATNGVGHIAASGISYITFTDSGNDVGIDSLTWTVPEPATVTLVGLGLIGLWFTRRRKI